MRENPDLNKVYDAAATLFDFAVWLHRRWSKLRDLFAAIGPAATVAALAEVERVVGAAAPEPPAAMAAAPEPPAAGVGALLRRRRPKAE